MPISFPLFSIFCLDRIGTINPSLMKLKLLEVLRNNDNAKLLELVNQIDSEPTNYDLMKLKSELLLYAVQVGPLPINRFIVETGLVDINTQDSDGNTALHLAAISNRNDVIEYLLSLPNINDCLYNKQLKQPIQCATNVETAQLMDYLRNKHIEQIASQLRSGFESRDFELLDKLLTNPRDKELLDINGTDPVTGDTVLIEFVKKDDYDMVKFILDHGGDPFKRSLSGKLPEESTLDPAMKKIIEDSFTKQNIMDTTSHPQEGSPTCKGFLKKWTNFAGGYKLRWFVLDSDARLSYYKSPNDMNNTCRGLIHLAHAMLKVDSSENTKFEIIIQNPSDGSPVRWHLKAEHSTEAQKWIWVLQNAIRYAKDNLKKQRKSVMLSHILNEDLPAESSPAQHAQLNHNRENNTPEDHIRLHSSAISDALGEEDSSAEPKPVSGIVSDDHNVPTDFRDLTKPMEHGADLPPHIHTSTLNETSKEPPKNLDISPIDSTNNDKDDDNDYNDSNTGDNINRNHNLITLDEQNTNISRNESFDSLRNQVGPVPDRTSQYSTASKPNSHDRSTTTDPHHHHHHRAPSVTSAKSNNSQHSKNSSLAKKLYKKPLKQLSKIGRKTRDSFVVDYEGKDSREAKHSRPSSSSTTNLSHVSQNNTSRASFISNSSSVSSPDLRARNEFETIYDTGAPNGQNGQNGQIDDEVDEEEEEDEDEDEDDLSPNTNKNNTYLDTDLYVVRNQITIQLKTFKDFLDSSVHDNSISKEDLAQMSNGILSTLNILLNQEGDCINNKYNELLRRFEKQQKISSIWENSIKQLEFEIQERETKIVELEDKLKALKKALRNSVSQLQHTSSVYSKGDQVRGLPSEREHASNATSAAALARQALTANMNRNIPPVPTSAPPFDAIKQQQEEKRALQQQREIQQNFQTQNNAAQSVALNKEPSYASQPAPFDPRLAEFIEETDDSDDEFFDAEESDVVKDMSVLERRETLKSRKNRQSKSLNNEPTSQEKQEQAVHEDADKLPEIPAVPAELPPPIPSQTQVEPEDSFQQNRDVSSANVKEAAPVEIAPSSSHQEESSVQPSEVTAVNNEVSKEVEIPKANFKPKVDNDGHYIVNKHDLVSKVQSHRYDNILNDQSFEGYEDPLRLSLAPEDNRPKMSLWGVLKSLVGKDMTKMTLPVTFNEPTSLLQRNVEVIEYSDLLDKAAAMESSTLRLVYVATFAASEYASTVGRIAKPFNPLLGETFEYARPDKGYRCFVEQVSHHPPISALVAESPCWSYYGESNVKTKFLGRSFDIKHLGTWFCEVYPDSGVECKNGQKSDKEVYSWKKVNNSVIGIIVGNPTIDNYGDMEIHNHMTGDYMRFNFKPRGWRASSAYEVKGEVFDASGKLVYYVGGHWNSKIFCKPADDKNAERFLVWEAAPRQEMMFHLTNFAATLNAPQPHLLPKIACTDTRLRPDQRAMENGDYDLAAEEKNRVEEKQREARRQRELKGEVYKPTFFTKSKHPVTGEEYWEYKNLYWRERMEGKLKDYKSIF